MHPQNKMAIKGQEHNSRGRQTKVVSSKTLKKRNESPGYVTLHDRSWNLIYKGREINEIKQIVGVSQSQNKF